MRESACLTSPSRGRPTPLRGILMKVMPLLAASAFSGAQSSLGMRRQRIVVTPSFFKLARPAASGWAPR